MAMMYEVVGTQSNSIGSVVSTPKCNSDITRGTVNKLSNDPSPPLRKYNNSSTGISLLENNGCSTFL